MTDPQTAQDQQARIHSGNLLVVSAPSGAGKSSLVKALISSEPGLKVAVSHTTRAPRPGEINGKHYHFVDVRQFQEMLTQEAFIEHAEVFGNFYGTAKSSIEQPLNEGLDLILEIDWQGARQVRQHFPKAASLFILPPSTQALRERLLSRGQDAEEIIEGRMRQAQSEISHYPEFDYLLVNDLFDQALYEIRSLITALRLRREQQQSHLASLLDGLQG